MAADGDFKPKTTHFTMLVDTYIDTAGSHFDSSRCNWEIANKN